MEEDMSKASIAVLLVLALMISILGTFTVLKAVDDYDSIPFHMAPVHGPDKPAGRTSASLTLSIGEPPAVQSQSASVSLSIQPAGDYQ